MLITQGLCDDLKTCCNTKLNNAYSDAHLNCVFQLILVALLYWATIKEFLKSAKIFSFSKPIIIIISLSKKNHAASSDVKWHFFTLLVSAFKFLFILKCYLLLFSSMCRFFCVKENHLTVTQRASPHGLIFYCTSMIRTCCETMTKWQLVPASESINHTKLFSAIITRTPNYSSEKHLKWREKLEGQIFFFVFHSDDISDTGFSTFQHAENCCSHSRAALGKCSMCVHEWKPLFTMVRHETSFMFCVFVSLSVSQLSAALLGWLRKDLLFSWGNCLYSAHLVGRYGGVERRDKSHWIT